MTLADSLAQFDALAAAWDEAVDAGIITIGGIDYACAITLSGVRPDLSNEGVGREQTFRADVRKTILATQPGPDTRIIVNGREFFVDPQAEQVDNGRTWIIRARRTV